MATAKIQTVKERELLVAEKCVILIANKFSKEGCVGYMLELKYKICFTSNEAPSILTRFIKRYVDREKLKKYYLLWNSLNKNFTVKCLPIEKIKNLPFPLDKSVLLYDERQKMLYGTTIKDVIDFVQSFEPWDKIDACIFDKEIDWGVAITHEDKILCWGDINIG